MIFLKNTRLFKRIAILISLVILTLFLWNTYVFFVRFKIEERLKMEIVATAMQEFATNQDLNADFTLEDKIIKSNASIPMILVDETGKIGANSFLNLDSVKAKDPTYLLKQLKIMKEQNDPIVINFFKSKKQYVYYRNSDLLTKLTYYPLVLILILALFLFFVYMIFTSSKVAEQNQLWASMAKETAHQIGTPLSSLLGWVAILKMENINHKYITEIEKDIHRLNTIADRFSKIGSLPTLKKLDVISVIKKSYEYLKHKSSEQISFVFKTCEEELYAYLNEELFSWVIENLIKNAIDAMLGKGLLMVNIAADSKKIKISISDTGKGMPKLLFKKIFEPGYTTKKRGWGLGLSLSKRIVEEYHNGRIIVKKSVINKGTEMEVQLNKIS